MMNVWKKWDRFLSWFSWLVLGAEVAYVIARTVLPAETVAAIDGYAGWFMPVLLAGAVGYITNWLALWYLFKPYEPHCGGRIQGIIPRQKKEMAVSLGNMVGKKLLNPDALVEEMKGEVLAFVNDASRMTQLRDWVQRYLVEHEDEIVEFISPTVEREVLSLIDSVATPDTWSKVWDEGILPRIKSEGSRRFIVEKLVEAIRDNAGGMIDEVRGELRGFLRQKLEEKLPFGLGAEAITDYVMDNFADYASLKAKLDGWLQRGSTQEMLREKLLAYADQLTVWMKNGEGQQAILDKLRLEQRVTEAVDGMSVATFHQTLNEFMAENFCAVQVLGFILGALVGALQLLARI